jgi:hypothetical protein
MVISHILGGIGNQMFQYAAGRALSLSRQQSLYLDIQDFEGYALHSGFQLSSVFNVDVPYADLQFTEKVLGFRSKNLIKKIIKRPLFKSFRGDNFIMEPHSHYWPQLASVADDCYLYGYWQSEKYFKAYEDIIRQDFCFRHTLDPLNQALKQEVGGKESISVHIRRGDYLSDHKTSQIMNVCGLEYYLDAIHRVASEMGSPHLYIFSDDIQWVRDNLIVPYPKTYIEHNSGVNSYKDMQLMSACRHHIIANSSFSWWGAWLNPSPNKIVMAPARWFVNGNNDVDIVPVNWVRI